MSGSLDGIRNGELRVQGAPFFKTVQTGTIPQQSKRSPWTMKSGRFTALTKALVKQPEL